MEFKIKVTVPKPFRTGRSVDNEIRKFMRHEANRVKDMFEDSVRTWGSHQVRSNEIVPKPTFKIEEKHRVGGNLEYTIGTDSKIYKWINDGTDERWAIMSSDFEPKTEPGKYMPWIGRGYAVLRGGAVGSAWATSHRIEARNFNESIAAVFRRETLEYTAELFAKLMSELWLWEQE